MTVSNPNGRGKMHFQNFKNLMDGLVDSGLTLHQLKVVLVLIECADGDNIAFPSVAHIAQRTGIHRRHVERALHSLSGRGWIETIRGGAQLRAVAHRRLNITTGRISRWQNQPVAESAGRLPAESAGRGADCYRQNQPEGIRIVEDLSTNPESSTRKLKKRKEEENTSFVPISAATENSALSADADESLPASRENPETLFPTEAPAAPEPGSKKAVGAMECEGERFETIEGKKFKVVLDSRGDEALIPAGMTLPDPLGFMEFWQKWPRHFRKQGRKKCLKIWQRQKLEYQKRRILKALAACKSSAHWRQQGGQYIPMPETWLNKTPWESLEALQCDGWEPGPPQMSREDEEHLRKKDAEYAAFRAEKQREQDEEAKRNSSNADGLDGVQTRPEADGRTSVAAIATAGHPDTHPDDYPELSNDEWAERTCAEMLAEGPQDW